MSVAKINLDIFEVILFLFLYFLSGLCDLRGEFFTLSFQLLLL
jgi:hypothetical protein